MGSGPAQQRPPVAHGARLDAEHPPPLGTPRRLSFGTARVASPAGAETRAPGGGGCRVPRRHEERRGGGGGGGRIAAGVGRAAHRPCAGAVAALPTPRGRETSGGAADGAERTRVARERAGCGDCDEDAARTATTTACCLHQPAVARRGGMLLVVGVAAGRGQLGASWPPARPSWPPTQRADDARPAQPSRRADAGAGPEGRVAMLRACGPTRRADPWLILPPAACGPYHGRRSRHTRPCGCDARPPRASPGPRAAVATPSPCRRHAPGRPS